ncbi:MAG: hypothetical protein SH821_09170 [Phototrophicales bacterium]|nr:hypothetical protein [Phototrophicales bacterium]
MKIPNYENAFVEEEKIVDYLLSEENSKGKAVFFFRMGFSIEKWQLLRSALLIHVASHEIEKTMENAHGIKYIIEGELQTPDGRMPNVRTIWIMMEDGRARLVSAYPI